MFIIDYSGLTIEQLESLVYRRLEKIRELQNAIAQEQSEASRIESEIMFKREAEKRKLIPECKDAEVPTSSEQ